MVELKEADTKKALFFDVDGTLVKDADGPTERVVNAIRRVRRKGHLVFICTGRVPCHIQKEVLDIGFDGIVASGGAYVAVGSKILNNEFLAKDIVVDIAKEYEKIEKTVIFEGEKRLFILNPWSKFDNRFTLISGAVDFEKGGRFDKEKIYKLCSYGKVSAEFLKTLSGRAAYIDSLSFYEFTPAHVGKAYGMKIMLDEWGISQADTLAFGDSSNDIDMLKFAGTGIAMGNALDHVKSIADKITAEVDKDGVAVAIDNLFS